MADSILRLRVQSEEYDNKLKRAAEGIRHLADVAHKGGGELTGLEKAELDYIKALGDMETKSRSAAGQARELENAFKELTVIYNNLNEVEKADEGGKALAASLETLRQRTIDAKSQLDAASQSLKVNEDAGKENSSMLEQLAGKFTVNIDAIKLFNIGLQASEMALKVAKDAFFNNEEQLDEWGRIVQSSESLYQGFLNSLNTGDISGYLANIGNIVQAARDAYNALDELGTYNAFNQINVEKTRTDMTQSIADFRGGQGSKDAVKAAGEAYKNELKDRQRLEREAYLAAVKEMAARRGVSAKDLTDALSGTYGHYQDLKKVMPTGTQTRYVPGLPGQAGRYEEYKVAQNNQERLGEALRHLNDTELQSLQALGAQAQRTGNEIAQVDRQLVRTLNAKVSGASSTTTSGRSGGGKSGTKTEQTELQQNQAKINALTQEYVRLGDDATESSKERQAEIQKEIELLRERNGLLALRAEQAQGRMLAGAGDFQKEGLKTNGTLFADPTAADSKAMEMTGTLSLQLDADAMEAVNEQITKSLKKDAKVMQKEWGLVAESVNNIGNAFASIEDPGAKAMGTVIQAIASIALGFAQASVQAGSLGPIGWLAWLAAGTAAMATTISTVHSLTGYADGGIVKGNHYSGDNINGGEAMVNAGELVLNKAQQSTLASQLQDGNGGGEGYLPSHVSGEQIYVVLNRYLKRTGRGELVTWE